MNPLVFIKRKKENPSVSLVPNSLPPILWEYLHIIAHLSDYYLFLCRLQTLKPFTLPLLLFFSYRLRPFCGSPSPIFHSNRKGRSSLFIIFTDSVKAPRFWWKLRGVKL